jgi:hypothetical protein
VRPLDACQLVFVDECGTHTSMTRRYAPWLPRGRGPTAASPLTASKNTTLLLASMGVEGMGECLVVEGATTKAIFEAYVERGC